VLRCCEKGNTQEASCRRLVDGDAAQDKDNCVGGRTNDGGIKVFNYNSAVAKCVARGAHKQDPHQTRAVLELTHVSGV